MRERGRSGWGREWGSELVCVSGGIQEWRSGSGRSVGVEECAGVRNEGVYAYGNGGVI